MPTNSVYKNSLLLAADMVEAVLKYTPQAYPVAYCRDAQTGGLIFIHTRHASQRCTLWRVFCFWGAL